MWARQVSRRGNKMILIEVCARAASKARARVYKVTKVQGHGLAQCQWSWVKVCSVDKLVLQDFLHENMEISGEHTFSRNSVVAQNRSLIEFHSIFRCGLSVWSKRHHFFCLANIIGLNVCEIRYAENRKCKWPQQELGTQKKRRKLSKKKKNTVLLCCDQKA